MKTFERQCGCGNVVQYTTKKALQHAERKNSKCPKCRRIGTTHSEETKRYLASLKEGTYLSEETKQKIGDACRGEKSYWFGRHHTEESKLKMSDWHSKKVLSASHKNHISEANRGHKHTAGYRRRMSEYWKGRKFSPESHIKMRRAAIQRVINQFGTISYNKDACVYIDKLNERNGWNLQHAENGGEIEICGYLVDGYDKDRNIVFEYDERQHFTCEGKLRKKDLKRQKEIVDHLKCDFYRYNAVTDIFYKAEIL